MRGLDREYLSGWAQIASLVRDQGKSFSGRERHCFFLNTGGPQFAHASTTAGLDYVDDGRASAVVDWDHDGDLDIWLTNRTGPRVRYLQNEAGSAGNYVAFRLQGTRCNRDAVGARLEIKLPGDPRPHIKTLHAGDGFLSQSSKWVHFGLGAAESVEQLRVRWPDGKSETFTELAANAHYRIVQDSGSAERWAAPRERVQLTPAQLANTPETGQARVVLTDRPRMSNVPLAVDLNQPTRLRNLAEGPALINLWQYTCLPCLQELQEFSHAADAIRQRGVNIVALHLNNPGTETAAEWKIAQQTLARFDYPFLSATAVDDCIGRLEKLQDRILQKHRGIVFPTSFLVDADHRIVAVYKGPLTVDDLLRDVALLDASDNELLTFSLPFAGKWYQSPVEGED